jgi:hypothetical protein
VPGSNGRPLACKASALPAELTAPRAESSISRVNVGLFWKSLALQAILVAVPFAILALALDKSFFEDYGWAVGPVVWLGCSVLTARLLDIPASYVVFSAVAGGVAGLLVMLATSHIAGMAVALLVFAASCGSWDPDALEEQAVADIADQR